MLQGVWCPATLPAQPVVTTADVKEQALRLLPRVQIGSGYLGADSLVNVESVLWAATGTDRRLSDVTVVGQDVDLRISFATARWNFGDGTTATWTSPGKPYDKAGDPCDTAQCADYTGHTYRSKGRVTIALTVSWHAQYSLDNGATWTGVDPGALPGPTTRRTLRLLEARGVLVPDP